MLNIWCLQVVAPVVLDMGQAEEVLAVIENQH
jgi:hypothetical protein